jgi:DNA-binding response OmpR family regulator
MLLQTEKILLVEDDVDLGMMLIDGLQEANYVICGLARNLSEAVTLTRVTEPSVAIVDVRLGADDGIQAAREMLRLASPAILFITGYPDDLIARADIGEAWLAKPLKIFEVIEAVAFVSTMRARGKRNRRPLAFKL